MLPTLRKPLMLFLLVLSGQMLTLVFAGGLATLTAVHLALLTSVAALVAWTWDFAVQRPVRQGLGRLERRMRRLSTRGSEPAGQNERPARDGDTSSLDKLLITRQKRIAAYTRRLRRELERLKAIYRQSHDAVLIFEPQDGRLVDCNPRAEQFLRMDRSQLLGINLITLHDEDEAYLRGLIDDVMDQP
ncbi:MAG: PAS domain-containing protein, partial [Gammaproteobacteria bacterium]|nr:PAS domain-containing protein [Gammaproteobacteria bacterium]